jgi:CubicO group peptidase (beta-lactamase class C family)
MYRFFISAGIALFVCFAATAQHATLDSFFTIRFPNQLNGGLLVAEKGKTVYRQSFGMADFSARRPNTIATAFNLASISKVITSTAVLQLMEKGMIKLDAMVKNYLPAFPFDTVTIKHLLTHTSGLPDLELYEDLVKQYPDTIISNKNILPELNKWNTGLAFRPGNKWRYCNTNFDLLFLVIEKVCGVSYETYIKQNIFQPAGMNATYVYREPSDPKGATASVYPNWFSDQYVPADSVQRNKYINYNISGLIGSTNIITTMEDMLLFDRAVFTNVLLQKKTLDLAFTPVVLNDGTVFQEGSMDTMLGEGKGSYGLGWDIFEQPAFGKSVGHGGFNYGLASFYFHRLDAGQTIIAYDNTGGPALGRVVTSAIYLLNKLPGIEKKYKPSIARVYGTALRKIDTDAALVLFHNMRADTANYYFNERELNWLGYDFLRASFKEHIELAREVFRNNTLLFPSSFNVFDSYAEVLEKLGKFAESAQMYRRSLQLNPENEGAKKSLERLKVIDDRLVK